MKQDLLTKVRLIPACLLLFSILFGSSLLQPLHAQAVSPALMQMAQGELQKRGLSEAEVTTRLMQKGIDVNTIAPTDFPKYQTQVTAVLNELEAEKKGKGTQVTPTPTTTTPTTTGAQAVQAGITTTADLPETTPQEAAADASQRMIKAAAAQKGGRTIYGHSLFTDKTLDIFRTTDGAQAPDTYVLGAGDEIHITIFGASQTEIQQRISPQGSIQPTGSAKIFLKGLTLAQARQVLVNKLSASYLFRPDQLAVTIVTARTILVNIFGEANVTGGFNLSALNSAFNALSAAGGPSAIGSVRRIQLIRGNSKRSMDLYAFMSDPTVQYSFDLQNNDIINVPVAEKLVSIEGAVKRPMTYEMLDNETVSDLIRYAGGLTQDVYPEFIQVQRYENGEEKLFEWKLSDVLTGNKRIDLVNGDVIRVKSINKPMETYVDIEGSVYYPGRFDLKANSTLSTLLKNAAPNYQAKTDFLLLERVRPDSTVEVITLPFPGTNGANDFPLKERDRVHIMDQATYRNVAGISVSGQVRKPFTRELAFGDRITVSQALDLAGGLKPTVYPVAYIFRRNLLNPVEVKYIRVELDKSADTPLQPGDQLNIYDNTTYTNVGELKVFGAVKTPGIYTYDQTMTVRDLIINAGGFNVGAAFNRVEVFRTVLSPTEQAKLTLITLTVDSNYQVVTPAHFTLQPYDQLVVRMTPNFTLGRTVELTGQVKYPGTYVLESRQTTLADVIKQAGGLLKAADPYGAQLFRTYKSRGDISIQVNQAIRHPRNQAYNPILFEGDVINIGRKENTVRILENATRMANYTTIGQTDSIKNIVFQGKRSAAWYIRNFAGGFQKHADRNSVTVTYANNQMVATKRFLAVFRDYPTVQPGATITLRMDPEKIQADLEPKEKLDFETTVSKTLSVLTSTLSIILLVRSLK